MAGAPATEKEALERVLISIMSAMVTVREELNIVRRTLVGLAFNKEDAARKGIDDLFKIENDFASLQTALEHLDVWIGKKDG